MEKKEEILPLLIEQGTKEPQKLDLKPLPVELKYAYLEENEQCPVVISSLLNVTDPLPSGRKSVGNSIVTSQPSSLD